MKLEQINKALDEIKDLIKSRLEKGKKFPTGTIRNWGGKDYKKVADGDWQEVKKPSEGNKQGGEKKVGEVFSGIDAQGRKFSGVILDIKQETERSNRLKESAKIANTLQSSLNSFMFSQKEGKVNLVQQKLGESVARALKIENFKIKPSPGGIIISGKNASGQSQSMFIPDESREKANKQLQSKTIEVQNALREYTRDVSEESKNKLNGVLTELAGLYEENGNMETSNSLKQFIGKDYKKVAEGDRQEVKKPSEGNKQGGEKKEENKYGVEDNGKPFTLKDLVDNAKENIKEGESFDNWSKFMKENYNLSDSAINEVKKLVEEGEKKEGGDKPQDKPKKN